MIMIVGVIRIDSCFFVNDEKSRGVKLTSTLARFNSSFYYSGCTLREIILQREF